MNKCNIMIDFLRYGNVIVMFKKKSLHSERLILTSSQMRW